MSNPIMALYVVGAILGAKTAMEGISEGNLTKAIIGGVGAYFGVTGAMGSVAAAGVTAGVTEGAVASGAMDAGLQTGIDMGLGEIGGEFAFNTPGTVNSLGANQLIASEAGIGSLAPSMLNSMPAQPMSAMSSELAMPVNTAPSLLDPMSQMAPSSPEVPMDAVDGMNAGLPQSQTITTKAPNPQMQGSNEMVGNVEDAMGDMWESAKQTGTKLGEFAENNPYMTSQLAGSAMQLLAGNEANDTAEEIAAKKEAWEREQMMLSATPANIYFDSSGVARDQYGKALQPG